MRMVIPARVHRGARATRRHRVPVLVDARKVDHTTIVQIDRDGERSIAMVLERGDVVIEVELSDPRALELDLHGAVEWLDETR